MPSWEFAQVGATVAGKKNEKVNQQVQQVLTCLGVDFSKPDNVRLERSAGLPDFEPELVGIGSLCGHGGNNTLDDIFDDKKMVPSETEAFSLLNLLFDNKVSCMLRRRAERP